MIIRFGFRTKPKTAEKGDFLIAAIMIWFWEHIHLIMFFFFHYIMSLENKENYCQLKRAIKHLTICFGDNFYGRSGDITRKAVFNTNQ